jgi:propionyl-CoA synthetase
MSGIFDSTWRHSLEQPEAFWGEAARDIDWIRQPSRVLDTAHPTGRWFPGATLNTCHNAVDRHVAAGHGERAALIWDSPVTKSIITITYAQLLERVARFAGGLQKLGVTKGDRVLIYMPMVPEGVIAMLAAARLGAIHSVVFGGFAGPELASRIDHARPKVLVYASCGIEPRGVLPYSPMIELALSLAKWKPSACVLFQREQLQAAPVAGRDVDWREVESAPKAACVEVEATDPLYVLYTSGTTGQPKGIVRDNGGHAVALRWSLPNVYGVRPGETFWAASDIGWVVGHSYIVYAPLLTGCTSILYEGKPVGTPDAGAFWRVASQHGVVTLFTAPTAFRALKRDDPHGDFVKRYDLAKFRALFLAGERCDPNTLHWAEEILKVPVIDNWWQTETGWPIVSNCLGIEKLPIKAGSPSRAVPGWDVRVLDATTGAELKNGEIGELAIKLPMAPGALPTLWENEEGFRKTYLADFPGYYKTADAGFKDDDGYVFVMTRTDDIINVAGHRLSTGAMEEVLSNHPDVAECAVIGVADELKGQLPLGLLVLKAGTTKTAEQVIAEVVKSVRDQIGPVAAFRTAVVVPRLPKTRSGKILRGTMHKIADGVAYKAPATIDDPAALGEIQASLQSVGYAKKPAE